MSIPPQIVNRVIELGIAIQQIPAPTFQEDARARFVHGVFTAEELADVTVDTAGNVYARVPGLGSTRPLVVSAHLDTVFPENTDLQVERGSDWIAGPGLGDNAIGVAGLLGLVWSLRQASVRLPSDLWLVANVAEEGLGDLLGMRAVVDRFGEQALAYIVLEGLALGQVYTRGLGVERYRIRVHTPGGHSWVDYGRPSAIHNLAELVTHICKIELSNLPRSSLNAGIISGGTSVNTIAAEAHLELDLRSECQETLEDIRRQVLALVQSAERPEVKLEWELIGRRPAGEISNEHALIRLAVESLEQQGIAANLNIGSTDANIPLSRGFPAVCLGLTMGGRAHTVDEYIWVAPLAQGLAQISRLVSTAAGMLNRAEGSL